MLSLTTIKARAKRGDFDGKQRSTACTIMNTLADGNLKITVRGRDRTLFRSGVLPIGRKGKESLLR